jgi:hypothetical protein
VPDVRLGGARCARVVGDRLRRGTHARRYALTGYAEAGIDELILSSNVGQPAADTIEMMRRVATQVMPYLT